MNPADIELEKNKIRNLKQYKDLDDAELTDLVESKKMRQMDFDVESLFVEKIDKKFAKGLAKKYLEDYTIETISDKNTLKQLIQLEVLNIKLQDQINTYYSKDADEKSKKIRIDTLIEAVHSNIKEISALKDRLGMGRKDNKDVSGYNELELLKKKFKKWLEENQGSRTIACGHCGKMLLLKIRTDKFDVQKHPFFKDKILYNAHLLKLLAENKITQEDVAKVLETSVYYVNWLLEKYPIAREEVKDNPSQLQFNYN